jgi:hypothetical protein
VVFGKGVRVLKIPGKYFFRACCCARGWRDGEDGPGVWGDFGKGRTSEGMTKIRLTNDESNPNEGMGECSKREGVRRVHLGGVWKGVEVGA